jgi:hypothetical protein
MKKMVGMERKGLGDGIATFGGVEALAGIKEQ